MTEEERIESLAREFLAFIYYGIQQEKAAASGLIRGG